MDASLIVTLAVTCIAFTGIWLINVMTEDAGVIDYFWGPGFAVIGLIHLWYHGVSTPLQWIFVAAVVLWAARLAGQLIPRHHSAEHEDGRYRAMRESGGPSFWWTSLFKVFLLQAVLLWLIAAPVHVVFLSGPAEPVNAALFWIGMVVFAAGLALEWVADVQLARGKRVAAAAPESALVTTGLWGISRHPNYVGEMILWWGLALSAYAISGSLIAFAGPVLLCAVIIGVSLPLTEQHLMRTRPAYGAYVESVPALIGRPRKGAASRKSAPGKQPAE